MTGDIVELLREHELALAFRKALKRAGSAVIAVPFWGKGAVKLLGLDAGHAVRVICNLDHPGCNPFVIEQLRKHKVRVRTHRRLHAKLYATDAAAIVGSSNASTNGLTVEGKEAQGWVELNVASSEAGFVAGVLAEFESLWNSDETVQVRAVDIKRANPPCQICRIGQVVHAQTPRGFGRVRQEFFSTIIQRTKGLNLDLQLVDRHTLRSVLLDARYWQNCGKWEISS